MDLQRVGIYGGSAGGRTRCGRPVHHGDFYKVGVADCGCHDNRMDKIWWNEHWMGWPVGPQYAEQLQRHPRPQAARQAAADRGRDGPQRGSRLDDAGGQRAEKADKDFELLVMTGTGHGAAETAYGNRRRMDFFVRHLLGKEPRWTE